LIGIDVHKKQWTSTLRLDGTYIKTYTMEPSAQALARHLKANYPNGNYFSVYEAGFCGTSYHQELCALGIRNIIINPADLPE
jgi:transposase